MTTLAQQLGEAATGFVFDSLPLTAVDLAKRGIADFVGVLLAGRREAVVDIARRFASGTAPARAEAVALATGRRMETGTAAFVDAVAGHALDFDDMALDGHPSVVLAPVSLAMAQRHRRSGRQVIAAYAAGYAAWATLLDMLEGPLHTSGWHPTATLGTLASAAAAARLGGLDERASAHALAIAASMAAGVVANFGSMMKPLQVGFAARNGILAADLAAMGATAGEMALEGRGGLAAALSPSGHTRLPRPEPIGSQLARHGLNVKLYPVCYAMHRIIDAALQLREDHAIRAEEIEAAEAALGRAQLSMLRETLPGTAGEARFSVEFVVACALLKGRVGLAEVDDAVVRNAAVRRLMERVRIRPLDDGTGDQSLFSPFDQVTVRLRNGAVLTSERVSAARGSMRRPIGWDGLWDKFARCARTGAPHLDARALFDRLQRLDELQGLDAVCALLKAEPASAF